MAIYFALGAAESKPDDKFGNAQTKHKTESIILIHAVEAPRKGRKGHEGKLWPSDVALRRCVLGDLGVRLIK